MKRITITICAAALLFACNSDDKKAETTGNDTKIASSSTDQTKTEEWVPVDSATAMKSMMEVGTPGPQHAMLAKSDGVWNAETTMWMAPDGPPMKSTNSTMTNKMMFGGRYQQSTFKGDMMGMPFEGVSTTGYDNAKKMYFSTWIDNMSTGIMNMEGTWDDASKSMTLKGKMICPANGKECEMREVYKIVDDNTQVMEMYGPDMKTGKEFKNMEIKLTKKR